MKLKIAVAISILSFFIVSTATLTSYLVIKERNEHNPIPNNTTPVPSANPTDLTLAKISEHNSVTDCWIIIDSKVYEVSKFLDLHAGGGFAIIPYCGKDATSAFNTKDKNPQQNHSNTAVASWV
jgi:cytochrome b involved in lipid metabolism